MLYCLFACIRPSIHCGFYLRMAHDPQVFRCFLISNTCISIAQLMTKNISDSSVENIRTTCIATYRAPEPYFIPTHAQCATPPEKESPTLSILHTADDPAYQSPQVASTRAAEDVRVTHWTRAEQDTKRGLKARDCKGCRAPRRRFPIQQVGCDPMPAGSGEESPRPRDVGPCWCSRCH